MSGECYDLLKHTDQELQDCANRNFRWGREKALRDALAAVRRNALVGSPDDKNAGAHEWSGGYRLRGAEDAEAIERLLEKTRSTR